MARPVVFAIHELNPWGGHDRSTLEIMRRLANRMPLQLESYQFEDPGKRESWPSHFIWNPVRPHFKKPAILMILYFFFYTVWSLRLKPFLKRKPRPFVHATGASSFVSDVVQVQFVNSAWRQVKKTLTQTEFLPSGARSKNPLKRLIYRVYHWGLLEINVFLERITYKRSKRYIAISKSVRRELIQYLGIPSDRIEVIYHGVDLDDFYPKEASIKSGEGINSLREKLGIPKEEVVFLFVGSFERKGLATLLRAFSEFKKEEPSGSKLLAVGSGNRPGFEALSESLGLWGEVIFVDPTKEVSHYFRESDVFVMPTLYEPFGLVILEALASGLPCVVSESAGGAELITPDKEGILLKNPRDVTEIKNALLRLFRDTSFRKGSALKARALTKEHTWEHVAAEYERVISSALRLGSLE